MLPGAAAALAFPAPAKDVALLAAAVGATPSVVIEIPGFAAERDEMSAEADAGESVSVMFTSGGAVGDASVLLGESVADVSVAEEVAVALGGGRVTPGASVALRAALLSAVEAVTVTVLATPEVQGIDAAPPSVLEALTPVSAPVELELPSDPSVPSEAPRDAAVEFRPLLLVPFALGESRATEEPFELEPEPVSPPETPVPLMRDSASACVSHVMDCRRKNENAAGSSHMRRIVLPCRPCFEAAMRSTGCRQNMRSFATSRQHTAQKNPPRKPYRSLSGPLTLAAVPM